MTTTVNSVDELTPYPYDYSVAVSWDAFDSPTQINFMKGGTYDSTTNTQTGGVIVFQHFISYDLVTGKYIHTKVIK